MTRDKCKDSQNRGCSNMVGVCAGGHMWCERGDSSLLAQEVQYTHAIVDPAMATQTLAHKYCVACKVTQGKAVPIHMHIMG